MKIYICFFGITRSLNWTVDSIKKNIIEEAKKYGDVAIYGHFYDISEIKNPRSGENGLVRKEEYRLLDFNKLLLDQPNNQEVLISFKSLSKYGDVWGDDNRSLLNLVHQLHSLSAVAELVDNNLSAHDMVVYCRPDLLYHNSFGPTFAKIIHIQNLTDTVFIPNWQHHGGYNDRFAICIGPAASKSYGMRLKFANEYCQTSGLGLGSEELLKFSLNKNNMNIRGINIKASRVRFDGYVKKEVFLHHKIHHIFSVVKKYTQS